MVSSLSQTVTTNPKNEIGEATDQHNVNRAGKDGSITNSRNLVYIRYNSHTKYYPIWIC
jgi:hypothetical protein